jgi:adenylate cyclase
MSVKPNGELVPEGGGDNIPLLRQNLTIGRRDSCDICLRIPNVSGLHCELTFDDGFWWIKDLGSTNGVRVNGVKVPHKLLYPGEKITIGQKTYTIEYQPPVGKHAMEDLLQGMDKDDIMNTPLLERAGLVKPPREERRPPPRRPEPPTSPTPEEKPAEPTPPPAEGGTP